VCLYTDRSTSLGSLSVARLVSGCADQVVGWHDLMITACLVKDVSETGWDGSSTILGHDPLFLDQFVITE
jgi:hypothetical protein